VTGDAAGALPPAEPVSAVVPRPAATVVLLRPGARGLEALLTHRPATMAFAPDVHVFPGGRVDDADVDPALVARSTLTPGDAATALGGDLEPAGALAAFVAAIRELFEEAGVLLADVGSGGADVAARTAAARSALLAGRATLARIAEDLDLRLRTDLLVPLSRWVTPATLPRRFDARFFTAALPDGAAPTFEGEEVVAHTWLRPTDALDAMAAGRLAMWLPTSTTLQSLEHAVSIDEIDRRLRPGPLGRVEVATVAPDVTRIVMPAGGGVAGQPVNAYLVGRTRHVLVDPGDPTGPALEGAMALAGEHGGSIDAVALTHADPDHAAGAEAVAELLGVGVVTGPGGGRHLPYAVRELADGDQVPAGDVPLRAIHAPGPGPEHVAYAGPDGRWLISGDLDGVRGARSIPGPLDRDALAASVARVRAAAPDATWLGGHPGSGGGG
jgi:glyoxylase-like metal-dependent hydrolase (beta-lactamase superfamily II)/8-oxo-dGTP pyrophosphatase MutT (NUDIX family)